MSDESLPERVPGAQLHTVLAGSGQDRLTGQLAASQLRVLQRVLECLRALPAASSQSDGVGAWPTCEATSGE